MSTRILKPGEKATVGTYIEQGLRGSEVQNSRVVVIEQEDSPLPPTQKLGHGWKWVQKHYSANKVPILSKVKLYELLLEHFNKGEIKILCFYLDVDYDLLEGEGKANKVRELIQYFERHGRLTELKDEVTKQRPFISWKS